MIWSMKGEYNDMVLLQPVTLQNCTRFTNFIFPLKSQWRTMFLAETIFQLWSWSEENGAEPEQTHVGFVAQVKSKPLLL